jgi:serine/threonine protein phosphatase PrpC
MLEQFRTTYTTSRRVRYSTWIGVLVGSAVLFWISGGFPPQAWLFLRRTIPLLPHLWMLKGPLMLLPLAALMMLCLTLLFSWVLLVALAGWIAIQQWRYMRERQSFEASLQKAQGLASDNVEFWQWWQEQTEPAQQVASRGNNKLHLNANANANAPVATLEPQPPLREEASSKAFAPRNSSKTPGATQTAAPDLSNAPRFRVGSGLDAGIKRKNRPNEDGLLAVQGSLASDIQACPFGLFVIADGMGGHANGQEASRLAIGSIRDAVIPTLLSNMEINDENSAALLEDGVRQANLAICQLNSRYQTDMGSTVTSALIVGTTITIANVGDSRTYRYAEDDGLIKITRDHSNVARLVESGQITADEAYIHPKRNEIYRCLGESTELEVDIFTRPLKVGTSLLLCSDGLWEMVRDQDIAAILRTTLPDASWASKALIQAALDGGGKDNISVIVVHVT